MLHRILSFLADKKNSSEKEIAPAENPVYQRAEEIQERLLKDNIIFLGSPINEEIATQIIAKFLFLEAEQPEKEISLYINSPGGAVVETMAIYDTIKMTASDVTTICIGQASGTAALLVACGTRGKRFAVRSARFQLVPIRRGNPHSGSPIEESREVERARSVIENALSSALHRSRKQIHMDMERGLVLTAEEALRYGFIDKVIERTGM
jgi:ATP-dependent Clp protease, protease subunit